ncbi:MAG TPA: glycosyltransferase family 2 protein [Desulfuromonadaceae bacterium]
MTIAITIPLYNQLHYTKLCIESIGKYAPRDVQLIFVDNASTDGTGDFLSGLDNTCSSIISNRENLGCAGAWNQGISAASKAEWIIILNNDVIVSPGWIAGLQQAAERWSLDIVSPGIREGAYNYDIESYAREYVTQMHATIRRGAAHGICFMVHRRVFDAIGGFDENFRIGQFEDKDFFLRASRAGFRLGTVGCSFLHHFGSVTQDALRKTKVVKPYVIENRAYYNKKWRLSWWQRALSRNRTKLTNRLHSLGERLLHRHTLMEKWINGRLRYY